MTAPLCFIDTETTGLDPERHEIWEVAMVLQKPDTAWEGQYVWQLPVDLAVADPIALNIGGFWERRWPPGSVADGTVGKMENGCSVVVHPDKMAAWCEMFAKLTWGSVLLGIVPSFDEERLQRLLRRHGALGGWHYQPIDVEVMAVGAMLQLAADDAASAGVVRFRRQQAETRTMMHAERLGVPPFNSDEVSRWWGIDPDKFDRHTALGDVKWTMALWDAIHAR